MLLLHAIDQVTEFRQFVRRDTTVFDQMPHQRQRLASEQSVNQIADAGNPDLHISGILMTMYNMSTNLSQQVVGEVVKHFGDRVFETLIPRNVRLSEAPSYGQPIIQYDPHCVGAAAYRNLAKEFIKRQKQDAEPGPDVLPTLSDVIPPAEEPPQAVEEPQHVVEEPPQAPEETPEPSA